MPARPKTLRASLCASVLTGGAIAAFLLPGVAHAAPSTQDKLDSLSADYDKAVEDRDGLAERIKAIEATIAGSDQTIDGAVALLGAPPATQGTLLSRLTTLSDLAREQTRAVDAATTTLEQANATKNGLKTEFTAADERVKKLGEERDDLREQIENEKAEESARTSDSSYTGEIPSVSGKAGAAVSFAYGAIGIPYVFGAIGPGGYDCSGLTMAAWKAAGVSLPHYTVDQWNATTPISRGDLRPGDLVFYAGLGHVGIYVGGGKVIHAPQPGESVKISSVDMMTPDGYRRV
ncbi:hypothetical protein Afil01_08740 [Actinorhabdospora filicis]|uniref:NlpC/P60 domain-containing protein n=1 Tax=Actinorhabdospora filicis TaxID=1785913 RepID=A0A9W6SHR7_9ACTN|nr:NlpC/P60 family protein [Actinorhabdospora filicis]GLZ76067.1 hypothetical protein Afil01_08740 [Actinorhabdospora filicis]